MNSGTPPTADRNVGMITLYANGFIIGSGEFRPITDTKNAQFIEALKKGEVPDELEQMCRTEWGPNVQNVGINLVDKSKHQYKYYVIHYIYYCLLFETVIEHSNGVETDASEHFMPRNSFCVCT